MLELAVPRSIIATIVEASLRALPEEACGLLAGQDGRAVRAYPIGNVLRSPVAYEMDAMQQVRTMVEIEDKGWELAAIYHSHPSSPAYPSPTDVAAAYYPDSLQLIISLADPSKPELRAFTIRDGQIADAAWFLVDD